MSIDIAGIGSVAEAASQIINKFFPDKLSDGERAQAEIGLQQIMMSRETAIIDAQKSVVVAELNQGDVFTKRARPTVVYLGLLFIFLVHVALPILAFYKGGDIPAISLPEEFWWSWGGICSVWSVGRTAEKRGAENKLVNAVIGKR